MAQATKSRRSRPVPQPVRPTRAAAREGAGVGLWDRMAGRTQHLICILFLLAVSLFFFAPFHFGGKSLAAGDTIQWRAMAQYTIAHEEATGEQALWAPNAFAGMPAYTISYDSPVPQLDDVAGFLRGFLWPTSHFFFLLLGTYLLVVLLTGQKLSGILAAVGYGLSAYVPVILTAGHNTKFIALCYAPWLLLAFAYALRRPGLLAGLLFAAALAVNLRAGHVQITYYIAFLLGIWWIVEAVGAGRKGRMKSFGAATLWMALGTVLGVLMIAQPYLLLREYRAFSTRGGGGVAGEGSSGLGWEYAMNWSQGVGELLTLAVANARGGAGELYWGPKVFTAVPHYVGGVVLLLAAIALLGSRRNAVWGLGIAALVMTFFSLGENMAFLNRPMFEYFPLFSAFRAPETWLGLVVLALAVLAALGVADLTRVAESAEAEARKTRRVYVATGSAAVLALLLLMMGGALFSFEKEGELAQIEQAVAQQFQIPRESPQVSATAREYLTNNRIGPREAAFRGDAMRTLIFVLLAGAVLVLYRRGTLPAWGMQAALALLVMVDLWGVAKRYFNEDVLVERGNLEAQIPTYDFDQFLLERQRAAGGMGQFRVLSYERNPSAWARPSYYYESLGGYSAAKVRLYQDFLDNVLFDPQTGLPNDQALDLLNTRYVVAPTSAATAFPGYEVAYPGQQGLSVLENPDATPRAYLVGSTEVIASAEETWARISQPGFDPTRTAILAEPIPFTPAPVGAGSRAEVALQTYTPDEIVWRVRTDAPRLLVASEVFYPAGWKAFVDDKELPIHRANYLLRAVPVPAGEHTVTMRFEPGTERVSLWLSALSALVVYGGILRLVGMAFVRRRKGVDEGREGGEPVEVAEASERQGAS